MSKELIKQWGENTAYCAKSHYKSADLRKIWIKGLIITNILFAIFSLLDFNVPIIGKIFGIFSLIASVLVLVYESYEDKNTIARHMNTGDEYLSIHYKLQALFHNDEIDEAELSNVKTKIEKLNNKKDKPMINQWGKRLAKKAIEKTGEMTTWWKQ